MGEMQSVKSCISGNGGFLPGRRKNGSQRFHQVIHIPRFCDMRLHARHLNRELIFLKGIRRHCEDRNIPGTAVRQRPDCQGGFDGAAASGRGNHFNGTALQVNDAPLNTRIRSH